MISTVALLLGKLLKLLVQYFSTLSYAWSWQSLVTCWNNKLVCFWSKRLPKKYSYKYHSHSKFTNLSVLPNSKVAKLVLCYIFARAKLQIKLQSSQICAS